MQNLISAVLGIIVSVSALADDVPAGNYKGILLESVGTYSPIRVVGGNLVGCTMSTSGIEVTRCQVDGGMLAFVFNGEDVTVPLDSYVRIRQELSNTDSITKFSFEGRLMEMVHGLLLDSPLKLSFQFVDSDPNKITGKINLTGLGQSTGILLEREAVASLRQ